MQTNWFYTVWPFIGLGGAIVIVPILLMTDAFRGNTTVSRWWDPVWLGWLAVPLYWVHCAGHMFRDLIPLLADRFHIVAPDLPGFGQSDMP